MAHSNANISFPSQVVSDAEKLSYDYGLKVAKAIETEWFHNDRKGNRYKTISRSSNRNVYTKPHWSIR